MRAPWRLRLIGAAAAVLCAGATLVPASAAGAAPAVPAAPTLAADFTEDFDGPAGSGVDTSRWSQETGDNNGNNHERQYYTPGTNNAALDGNGHLVITARKENPSGYQCWYGTCQYTSARMNTSGKFSAQYGHVETRMKIPRGQGMWPAFWMLGTDIGSVGWPGSGEIDVMENIGREPGTVHGTLHGPGYSGAGGIGAGYSLSSGAFADAFHTFAVDWAPDRVSWSVDGHVYQTRTPADIGSNQWAFNKPFFLILNLAVGGDWPGDPDASTSFPQQLVVDYVHVSTGNTGSTGQAIKGLAGKCVDVQGASAANGTPVQLYDCNGTAAQQWSFSGSQLRALGKCLDVTGASTASGAKLQLWDCTGGGNQQWTYNAATHDLVNLAASKCMDVTDNNSANGTQLQIWECSGNANQKWTMS
ncbi:ricin-type beta-trefoil lectin domain protein [Streptomyces sp. NPDC059524]|uniref:ricin-type beta-trefoil lectin domain protein n=1 Tax=Streptomyces sp. NPDC059524 TaxID=3346856 RepID=UPI00369044B1